MGFSSLMSMIYDQIDTVMLKYFRPDTELGLYVASYSLMSMSMSFLPILGQVFLPLLSETAGQNSDSQKRYLRWLAHATVGLAMPAAVGGYLLAFPITQFVLGGQYSGAGTLFRWLMLTLLTGSLASYFLSLIHIYQGHQAGKPHDQADPQKNTPGLRRDSGQWDVIFVPGGNPQQ